MGHGFSDVVEKAGAFCQLDIVADLRIGIRGAASTRIIRLLDVPKELAPAVKGDYVQLEASFMPAEAKGYLVVPS